MIHALAPRMPRGFSWVWSAIVAVAWAPSLVVAQTAPPATGEAKPRPDDQKPAPKEEPADEAPDVEVFVDPNAKKALTTFNPLLYSGPQIKVANAGDDRARVQNMAARAVNTDPDFIKRYVEFFAVELTKRDNLNAVLNPPASQKPGAPESRYLERAVDALTKPIIDGKANENGEFLTVYRRALFESSLPKLLEANHNYLTRIDAMIVLGMAGSTAPNALDLYINQLKKPDQLFWVKLWAARGLTNAAQGGLVDLDASKANLGTESLVVFLDSDPKLPWPAQMRALEALGSLRVAIANSPRGKIDAASVAMRLLADPEAKPEVRAWAAWALGMMKIAPSVAPYNFDLIGHEIGELTGDLGRQIVREFDADPANFDRDKDLAAHLTSLLLFQVYPALIGQVYPAQNGEVRVRDSGLLNSTHPNAVAARPLLAKIDDRVKAVTREAFELLRAGGAGNKAKRNDLDAKLADLKSFLGQAIPKDRHLVPGGPEIPAQGERVAGAAGR
jgi:hypothetical protein